MFILPRVPLQFFLPNFRKVPKQLLFHLETMSSTTFNNKKRSHDDIDENLLQKENSSPKRPKTFDSLRPHSNSLADTLPMLKHWGHRYESPNKSRFDLEGLDRRFDLEVLDGVLREPLGIEISQCDDLDTIVDTYFSLNITGDRIPQCFKEEVEEQQPRSSLEVNLFQRVLELLRLECDNDRKVMASVFIEKMKRNFFEFSERKVPGTTNDELLEMNLMPRQKFIIHQLCDFVYNSRDELCFAKYGFDRTDSPEEVFVDVDFKTIFGSSYL